MENKRFVNVIIWVVFIGILFAVGFFVLHPALTGDRMETYIRAFLVLFILQVFGILRLYNSIVKNSAFIIKLRTSMESFKTLLPQLERVTKSLDTTLRGVKNSNDALKKSTDTSNERMDKLQKEIAGFRTFSKPNKDNK